MNLAKAQDDGGNSVMLHMPAGDLRSAVRKARASPTVFSFIIAILVVCSSIANHSYAVASIGMALIVFLLGQTILYWRRRLRNDVRIHVATREGLCPACRYSLAGIVHVAGLVTCPECGAQWRAERFTFLHVNSGR
jgi:hypothetical protein